MMKLAKERAMGTTLLGVGLLLLSGPDHLSVLSFSPTTTIRSNVLSSRTTRRRSPFFSVSSKVTAAATTNEKHTNEDTAPVLGVTEKAEELRELIQLDNIKKTANDTTTTTAAAAPIAAEPVLVAVGNENKQVPSAMMTTTTSITADAPLQMSSKEETKQVAVPSSETTTTTTTAALSAKAVLRFVTPTLALWIAPPVMSLIDTAVVGRFCGPLHLAALSPACTLIDSTSYLFMFIATAATNLVASASVVRASTSASSQHEQTQATATTAADAQAATERIVSEALFLALCSGTFLAGLVFIAGRPLLQAIAGHASASTVPLAWQYAAIRAFGQPAVVMASVARAAALARKDTTGPLCSVALAFVLNAVGTVALVRGTRLGIRGAAIGTLVADVAAALFLFGRLRQMSMRRRKQQQQQQDDDQSNTAAAATTASTTTVPSSQHKFRLISIPTADSFRQFLQYAAPIFFTILGKSVVYNGVALAVGRLGSTALAAHQVLLRSFFFWTPVGDSVGMTSQVFLPGILAQQQEEETTTGAPSQSGAKRLLFGTGVACGLVAATLAGWLPSQGAALFTTDAAVAAALRQTAPILALSISMHAIALTCEGMLLAQRDLAFLSNSYVITTIATAALLLSPFRPATLGGSWWILALFQGGRALQFALRNLFLSKRGKQQGRFPKQSAATS